MDEDKRSRYININMLALDLFEEFEGPPEPTLIDALRDFLPIAVRHLKLKKLPKIKLLRDVETDHLPSFGKFSNDDRTVHVGVKNRHPNDILRTLAHELTHYAQGEHGKLDADSWHTGSPVEDQANAEAGVIMREFNKKFPQYMALKPIVFEAADYERDMQSDPSDPFPFPKGTTLVNVSDVYDWYKLGMAVPALDKADPRVFNKGVPHTVFAFGSEEEEHRMTPLLKRLGFTLHDIDKPEDYEKAIRASDVVEHLEQYVAEKWSKKYKKSINCSNPKGFSQKAHCAGRKKNTNVAEGGAETSWSDGTEKITLQDILELTKHIKQINLPINDNLKSKLIHWDGNPEEIERINQVTVSNQFPILIIVDEQGQIKSILDGNHRLHKAIRSQAKTIPAKLIKPSDLSDQAKRIFHLKEQGVVENFADGKGPGRPGDSQRHGIPKGATMAELEKAAKSSGRKGQLARWQINMRRGKKK